MGDDIDGEVSALVLSFADVVHCQRYAIKGDRAFGGDHRRKILRHADSDANRIAFRASADHLSDGIDVAGDDMAAELVAEPERPLKVEPRSFPPMVACGFRDRLGRDVDCEPIVSLVDHGHAHA